MKKVENGYYKYNANKEIFYYTEEKDNLSFYAQTNYNNQLNKYSNNFNYVVVKDNTIIEYQLYGKDATGSKYHEYINEKLSEINKLKLND